ncbi:MAG: hypothetical protein L6V95_05390 [Candidatus Melainabacteria bacterium]|nr:MAG: hypothetical protein L6V95_05390 [Candidatus Melainabacteria bacterium]
MLKLLFYSLLDNKNENVQNESSNIKTLQFEQNNHHLSLINNVEDYKKEEVENKSETENFKIIGQFLNTYIIFEENENLYIIDQHIADERYIYNNLKNSKNISSQIILISDIFEPEPVDLAFLR